MKHKSTRFFREKFRANESLFNHAPLSESRLLPEYLIKYQKSSSGKDKPITFLLGIAACLILMFGFIISMSESKNSSHWIDGAQVMEKVVDPFYIALTNSQGNH